MKALSFSEARLWFKSREEYYKRYILGKEFEPTEPQRIGRIVHAALENPAYSWLKEIPSNLKQNIRKVLDKIEPLPEHEVVLTARTKYGLPLLAIFDGLDRKQRKLVDYKTFSGREAWSQFIVDDHLQFSFYAWIWKLTYHSYFSDIEIDAINLDKGTVRKFHTVRSRRDIEYVEGWTNQAVREIKEAGWWDKRLNKTERAKLNTQPKII
jgi:hypothetical protein